MSQLFALSVSIGLLGGLAMLVFQLLQLAVWAGFIAWACYFHCGGDTSALKQTIVGNVFGAFCAWVAAILLLTIPVAGSQWMIVNPGVVAVTVLLMCLASRFKALSVIPASVYGYAATFAYLLQTPHALTSDKLLHLGRTNGFIMVAFSLVLGALFGSASAQLAGTIQKS